MTELFERVKGALGRNILFAKLQEIYGNQARIECLKDPILPWGKPVDEYQFTVYVNGPSVSYQLPKFENRNDTQQLSEIAA